MIYVAGPFFTDEQRRLLNHMIEHLRKTQTEELFIPMEHFIENGDKMSNQEWAQKVFEMDVQAINNCSQVVAMYLGHYSDTGTAWEIGYAYAKGIPVSLWIPIAYRQFDMSIMPINSANNMKYYFNVSNINQK